MAVIEQRSQMRRIARALFREAAGMGQRHLDRAEHRPLVGGVGGPGEGNRDDLGAKRLEGGDGVGDHRRRLGRHVFKHRGAVDADPQAADRAGAGGKVIGHRVKERGRVGGVRPGDHRQDRGAIGRAARHRPDMVETVGERKDPGAADPAPGALHPGDAAGGRGEADRAAGVRAERAEAQPRRDRDPRARRRRPRPALRVPRVLRRRHLGVVARIGALGHAELAQDHRPGLFKPRGDGGIAPGRIVAQQGKPGRCGGEIGLIQVLEREGHAMQRPAVEPLRPFLGGDPRRLERMRAGQREIGIQRRIDRVDAVKHRLGHLERAGRARGDQRPRLEQRKIGNFARRQVDGQGICGHDRPSSLLFN
ncbi:hypothetical protein SDC9_46416 [bioreactor metagenome]|uniref:Uncharacterized protein n=1 Tax=bioreactor metagenome TaxID=1076179 RepID=A0A644WC97_9ZZZZ